MERFLNREEAGERLGERLAQLGVRRPIVLGIPRGGVIVAVPVADAVDGELGAVVARKLRAPHSPELAIGAVTADRRSFVDAPLARQVGADEDYLEQEVALQAEEARRREARFGGSRPNVAGRDVIIVDDGIATGATALAAVRAVRGRGAASVTLAAPVGSPDRIAQLRREADRVVTLIEDPDLLAVGEYYYDFHPVSDEEVESALATEPSAIGARQRARRIGPPSR